MTVTAAAATTTTVAEQARRLTGSRLGLMEGARTILLSAGQPRLFSVTAIVSRTERYAGVECDSETGAIGFTREHATAGAIGELVERYCVAYCDRTALTVATARELGPGAVGMDAFQIHADEEYARPRWPFPRYTADSRITWATGRSLVTGEVRHVPACLVFVPYQFQERSDFLALSVSSGNAAHTDRDAALCAGLFEVVERDAFMITWLRQLRLPRVDYLADPALAALYQRHFAGCNLQFHVFDMTTDIALPTYLCLVEGRSARGPFVGMGASTRLSPRAAVTKALLEAAQDLVWCRDLIRRRPEFRPAPDWSNVLSFEDRVRLYCEPEMIEHVGFLLHSPRRTAVRPEPEGVAGPADELRRSIAAVTAVGLEPLVIDQTAPDVAEAGWFAPKVMIPGTVPLAAVHTIPQNGSPRLHTVPAALGLDGDACPGFNPIPHLFP